MASVITVEKNYGDLENYSMDLVICSLPPVVVQGPLLAPYLLKGYLVEKGFEVEALDLNMDLWKRLGIKVEPIGSNMDLWKKIDFNNDVEELIQTKNFRSRKRFEKLHNELLKPIIQDWAKTLVAKNAKWIGLSMFSRFCYLVVEHLIVEIKKINPDQKIVIGGPGTKHAIEELTKRNIQIDSYTVGAGEVYLEKLLSGEIPEFLHNKIFPQIVTTYPDYSDVNWEDYPNHTRGYMAFVMGSKGCVRDCTFCNIKSEYGSFSFRTGVDIANELIHNYEEYGLTHFTFSDSLINGSVRDLRIMCKELIKYYDEKGIEPFSWAGQFIIKPIHQMPIEDYELLSAAGCYFLKCGIESGSEKVRNDMKKGFSNDDIYFFMESCRKTNIEVYAMFIVGYPSENEKDFRDTLRLIDYLRDYKDMISISTGRTLFLDQDADLFNMLDHYGIELDYDSELPGRSWKNENSDFFIRADRQLRLEKYIRDVGMGDILHTPFADDLPSVIESVSKEQKDTTLSKAKRMWWRSNDLLCAYRTKLKIFV